MKAQMLAMSLVLSGSFASASDGQGDALFDPDQYGKESQAATINDEILVRNILGAMENEINDEVRNRGKLVLPLIEVAVDVLTIIGPGRIADRNTSAVAGISTDLVSPYVASSLGNDWANYTKERITSNLEQQIRNRLPEIKNKIETNRAIRVEENLLREQLDTFIDRQKTVFGPPIPNAFY
ncbi:hypothetical protein ROLI_010690 [Roseobacter fucihabitans]|uniref:Uncharacterized protein n=1 Tax=Roseobacter fucihabitans TaxID=1537242 RepID=A0ABZ2BPR1_9RHOB|nr:hypothetical protein [Roseobacter litoralis]MBC6965529.1 hypothetical protein [Roseobacter litoralis]